MMIKPQPQLYRHDPENGSVGDCFKTCVAMLLGVDADQVPHFAKDAIDAGGDPGQAVQMLRDWLEPQGLGLGQFLYPPETTFSEIIASLSHHSPGIPFMVLGKSPRGDWGHVVVVQDGKVADPALGTWRDDPPEEILTGPAEGEDGEKWWWVECIVRLPS